MKTLNGVEIKPDERYTVVYQANYLNSKFTHIASGYHLRDDFILNEDAFEPWFYMDGCPIRYYKGCRYEGDYEIKLLAVLTDEEAVRRLTE